MAYRQKNWPRRWSVASNPHHKRRSDEAHFVAGNKGKEFVRR